MSDRYLWDGTGPTDPEVERLEHALTPLRYAGRVPEPVVASPWRRRAALAAAAAIVLGAGALWTFMPRHHDAGGWPIAELTGPVRIDRAAAGPTDRLGVGQWLETDDGGRVEMTVADIGSVTVHAGSRLRVRATRPDEHRLELARGRIEAMIIAPPRLFFVDTPSATAIDMGCAYDLVVDEAGNGRVTVTIGRIDLERDGRTSRVPEGARCMTRAGVGPGTPYFVDANEAFVAALDRVDFSGPDDDALDTVIARARPYDTLTLWHLVDRLDQGDRIAVLDRLIELSPPPAEVDLGALRRGETSAMEQWWRDLERAW